MRRYLIPSLVLSVVVSIMVLRGLHEAPADAAAYTVPDTITANCSSDVSSDMNGWLDSVPDGSTINFPAGACYGLNSGLVLADRNNLTINGNGGQVKLLATTSNSGSGLTPWRINGGSNITLENMSVIGDNPSNAANGTTSVCQPSGKLEWQYGVNFGGTQTGALHDVNVYRVCGDFVEAESYKDANGNNVWSRPAANITVSGGTFSVAGRQGFGLTNADTVTISNVSVSHVGQDAIDAEPDVAQAVARNITVKDSSFTNINAAVFANFGAGGAPNVGNMSIINNTQTGTLNCYPMIWAGTPSGASTRSGYTISGNHFAPFNLLAEFDSAVASVTITNNVDSGAEGNGGCGKSMGIIANGVNGATVTGNDFGPTVTYLAQLANSVNITACGNKDAATDTFSLPVPCTATSGPVPLTPQNSAAPTAKASPGKSPAPTATAPASKASGGASAHTAPTSQAHEPSASSGPHGLTGTGTSILRSAVRWYVLIPLFLAVAGVGYLVVQSMPSFKVYRFLMHKNHIHAGDAARAEPEVIKPDVPSDDRQP